MKKIQLEIYRYDAKEFGVESAEGLGTAVTKGYRPGKDIPLRVITIADMKDLHAKIKVRGHPTTIAYDPAKGEIWVHPIPIAEVTIEVKPEPESPPESPGTLHMPVKHPVLTPGEKPKGRLGRILESTRPKGNQPIEK